MTIYIDDTDKFQHFLDENKSYNKKEHFLSSFLFPILLFGSMGGITWAMRGSSGYGGFDGTLLPGFFWAILFYFIFRSRGIDVRSTLIWLGLGISLGGMLGYGIYVSWIHGDYYVWKTTDYLPINPIWGWIWAGICGISWGGTGGAFLGWSISKKKMNLKKWLIRIFLPLGFALLGIVLLISFPQLFYPHYNSTDYPLDVILEHTNTANFVFLMWWIGTLVVTGLIEKEYTALKCNLALSLLIGFGFTTGIWWNLLSNIQTIRTDYWKLWEIQTGFFGGIGYVIAINLLQKDIELNQEIYTELNENGNLRIQKEPSYRFSLLFSLILLVLWGSYGSSYSIGYYLNLYEYSLNQYDFPLPRLLLMIVLWLAFLIPMLLYLFKLKNKGIFEKESIFHIPNLKKWIGNLMIYFTIFASFSIFNPNAVPMKIIFNYLFLYWVGYIALKKM